jgi:hypothetical protein
MVDSAGALGAIFYYVGRIKKFCPIALSILPVDGLILL